MTYTVQDDIYFKNFISTKNNASDRTIKNYIVSLTKFYNVIQEPLGTIITKCKEQQETVIEKTISQKSDENGNTITRKSIITFDVNNVDSLIKIYLDTFVNHCKAINNKNTTINQDLLLIRAFFKFYDITLPRAEKLKADPKNWILLKKEDFKFIMDDSTLNDTTLISQLKSSGMRLSDALKLSIGDFMVATSEYHNYTDVNEFIDNAPQNMIATWEFYPEKTKRYNIPCITFSDPETCNFILQNLRKIKNEYLPRINKEQCLNLKLSKNDALFPSRKANYKGFISPQSITNRFARKNKKLFNHYISAIEERIEKGELSEEDKEVEINKIPVFHAHACRKYFETIISRNCGNLRLCAVMEGHAPPMANDPSYIKHDVNDVKEAYMAALEDLSLENTEAKVYTSEVRREMEAKIDSLQKENESLKEKYEEKDGQFQNMEERLSNMEKLFSNVDQLSDDDILKLFARKKTKNNPRD